MSEFVEAVGTGVFSNAVYAALASAWTRLRSQGDVPARSRAVAEAVQHQGVALADDQAERLSDWLAQSDLLNLHDDAGNREALVTELARVVFRTGSPEYGQVADPQARLAADLEQADKLASALWPAVLQLLDSQERRGLLADIAALHTEQVALSILDGLAALDDSIAETHHYLQSVTRTLLPQLPLERPRLRPPAGAGLSPYELLWARYGVVPYDDREGWLDDLVDWCRDSAPVAVTIAVGTGGMGKTRLALELCRRMSREGWAAGLLPDKIDDFAPLVAESAPRLIVVDYAEQRPQVVSDVLEALTATRPLRSSRVRVMLLVRRPTDSDPRRLFAAARQDDVASHLLNARVLALSTVGSTPGGSEAVGFSLDERRRLFDNALTAFTHRLGVAPAGADEPPDLDAPAYRSPLMVLISALLAADPDSASPPTGASRRQLLDLVLDRERARHWTGPGNPDPFAERAVAVGTMFGADDEAEMCRHLAQLDAFASPEKRVEASVCLHHLYAGPRYVNPLEPDLLGEHMVARHLTPELTAYGLSLGTTQSAKRFLRLLGRLLSEYPDHRDIVGTSLGPRLEDLAFKAIEEEASRSAEPHTTDSLAEALAALLPLCDIGPHALIDLPARLGPASARLAAATLASATQFARTVAESEPWVLASCLDNLGVRLVAVAHGDEALRAFEESVLLWAPLAAADPGQWRASYAQALLNLAARLGERSRLDEALEAIETSIALLRQEEAETDDADERRHVQATLANAIDNRSVILSDRGQLEDALAASAEAVALRQRLLQEGWDIDVSDFALSLNNHAIDLAAAGRQDEALDAAERALALRNQLAATNPLAHLPDLATSHMTLALQYEDRGRHATAIKSARRAVDIMRALAFSDPDLHGEPLAHALDTLAIVYQRGGGFKEGVEAAREAVDVWRSIAPHTEGRFDDELPKSLLVYAMCLVGLGDPKAAMAAGAEAAEAVGERRGFIAVASRRFVAMAAGIAIVGLPDNADLSEVHEIAATFHRVKQELIELDDSQLDIIEHVDGVIQARLSGELSEPQNDSSG